MDKPVDHSLNKSPDPHSIVERLRFDATRCEIQFSKGVAANIDEAATIISDLQAERDEWKFKAETVEIDAYIETINNRNDRVAHANLQRALAAESSLSRIQSETVERVISICEKLKLDFLNPTYAVDQPHSSFAERFAVQNVIDAIRSSLTNVGEAKTAESEHCPPTMEPY